MLTKPQLIDALNKDLAYEFAAAIQYVQHAACITGPEYQNIQKELVVHANEEIGHAIMLSEQIAYLGGVPAMDVEERLADKASKKMLEQDLAGEQLAVSRYRERIGQAQELKLYGLEAVLKEVLMQEEEHERDLQAALGF